jgi:hypothetical protein
MRKSIILAAAAFALGATVAAGQPKDDLGYDPRPNAFEQLDAAAARAAAFLRFIEQWRNHSAAR